MGTAAVTNVFATEGNAVPGQMNTNFTDLVTFLQGSVVHADGTNTMTNPLVLSGDPTSPLHAATKHYADSFSGPTGTWSSFTPVVYQAGGVVPSTATVGRFISIGQLTYAVAVATITGSGSTGVVSMNPPVTINKTDAPGQTQMACGSFFTSNAGGGFVTTGTVMATLNPSGSDKQLRFLYEASPLGSYNAYTAGDTLAFFLRYWNNS